MHNRSAARSAHLQLSRLVAIIAVIGMLAPVQRAGAQQAEPPRFDQSAAREAHSPQLVDHSDAYYTRLTIHRYASYAMIPLFGAEYLLGQKLINDGGEGGVKSAHVVVATGIGALFAVNTVTGVWNLYEARKDPNKLRRYLHAALLLGADAGMAYTASIAPGDDDNFFDNGNTADKHRNAALASFGAATAGTLLMWLWK